MERRTHKVWPGDPCDRVVACDEHGFNVATREKSARMSDRKLLAACDSIKIGARGAMFNERRDSMNSDEARYKRGWRLRGLRCVR